MLNLFSNATVNSTASSGTTEPGAAITGAEGTGIAANGTSFADLLTNESSLVEMLDELKTLLSAEDFMTLEGMLAEGQTLPLAEIVAALRQQLSASDMEQLASQTLKLSDVIPDLKTAVETTAETSENNVAEETIAPLVAEQAVQTIIPITLGHTTIPVTIAVDQAVVQSANGKSAQSVVAGQAVVSSNAEGDAPELSFNMNNSSADSETGSGKNLAAGRSQLAEALAAAQTTQNQKMQVNNLFRTTEAGLSTVNNVPIAPGLALNNNIQPLVHASVNALPIHTPMGEKGWDQAVGERMLWMVGRQIQGAEVRITPPQLGPIDIRISIQNDQANVAFTAQHGVVREALEASIPRLREMLSENNLQLVNVDVNQRNNGEQRASHFFNHSSSDGTDGEGYEFEGEEGAERSVLTMQSDGLVDDFA